ncbi:MAG: [Fe-Fe] hydrogenase large subunit C-terminal domain-containing protein [bacterium]|nr:[Fe-Fe] hydrogenase large subunit C-terminal domain-containing protein [bacterium]
MENLDDRERKTQPSGQIVFTNKARCRDCYRCVRVCPVKAIRMHKGQAFVVEERCISCGTCIRECPQGAKSFRDDIERAVRLTAGGKAAASVAPSFVSVFSNWEQKRLASALRRLGFAYVAETAVGAYYVAHRTAEIAAARDQASICTACPAVVGYVERYRPEAVGMLVPVVSPMLAHAGIIREKLGADTPVVFIGPCVAKKAEADRPENAGLVNCVLTFQELLQWLEREGISLSGCEESRFDDEPSGEARFFPLSGGLARTASLETDMLAENVLSVSGFEEVAEVLDSLTQESSSLVVDPLFCRQGCINGPAVPGGKTLYDRRRQVIGYASTGEKAIMKEKTGSLEIRFKAGALPQDGDVPEADIMAVLERTGKTKPEDELNCGACGYNSCREKAVAVIRGMAEVEMCIPYMRRLAEQRTDRIIETSPNGIVILDERLHIISMNPAFRRFFMCSEAVCGRHISYLMDPELFERLAVGDEELVETTARHDNYNLICHQILYPLREDRQYVGIFVNITNSQASQEKLEEIRSQTVNQARELLENQVGMAQQLARFLGESTARSEELVQNLLRLAGDTPGEKGDKGIWDTSTSR